MEYDLRGASFDGFVDFFFDRSNSDWHTEYYLEEKFDSAQCLAHYIRLFREPAFLLRRFDRPQLEQGFWAIGSGILAVSVTELLWDETMALEQREDCVRAMYHLYKDLFSIDHLETSAWMWWDQVAYDYGNGLDDKRHPYRRGEAGHRLQDAMFETLCQILKLPCEACQWDALHGFNHLRHPKTEAVLRGYLSFHPELNDEEKAFVETCIKGEFM